MKTLVEKYTYSLTKSTGTDEDGNDYVGYGIVLTDESGREIDRADDLSCDEETVRELVRLCEEGELSPVHFRDVVEDFLA